MFFFPELFDKTKVVTMASLQVKEPAPEPSEVWGDAPAAEVGWGDAPEAAEAVDSEVLFLR